MSLFRSSAGGTPHILQLSGPEPFAGYSFTSKPSYHESIGGNPHGPKDWELLCDGAVRGRQLPWSKI